MSENVSLSFSSSVILARILQVICSVMVDIFALLTGYFCVKKVKFHMRRLADILIMVFFYSCMITLLWVIFFPKNYIVNDIGVIRSIMPFLTGRYWYILCYVIVFICMPYINIVIVQMNRKQLKSLIVVLFVLFSLLPTILNVDHYRIARGYSPWWLLYCYFIGAYIKKYNPFETKRIIPVSVLIVNTALTLSIWSVLILADPGGQSRFDKMLWSAYSSPLTVLSSIMLLQLFRTIQLKGNVSKRIVCFLSSGSLAVYIIHAHAFVLDNILHDKFGFIYKYHAAEGISIIIISSLIIYILCIIVEKCRLFFFGFFNINKVSEWIGDKADYLLGWQEE